MTRVLRYRYIKNICLVWCKSAIKVLTHKPESQCKSSAVVSSFPYVQFFPVYAVPEYCPRSDGNFGTSQSVPSSAPPPPLHPLDEAAAKTSFKQKESETVRETLGSVIFFPPFYLKFKIYLNIPIVLLNFLLI